MRQTQAFLGPQILALLPPLTPQAVVFLSFFCLFLLCSHQAASHFFCELQQQENRDGDTVAQRRFQGQPRKLDLDLRLLAMVGWRRLLGPRSLTGLRRGQDCRRRSQHLFHLSNFVILLGALVLRLRIPWTLLQRLWTFASLFLQQSFSICPVLIKDFEGEVTSKSIFSESFSLNPIFLNQNHYHGFWKNHFQKKISRYAHLAGKLVKPIKFFDSYKLPTLQIHFHNYFAKNGFEIFFWVVGSLRSPLMPGFGFQGCYR